VSNSNIIRILSPLIFFVFHVIYLVVLSKDQFFNKWVDGSFTFFVALVLCNIIRARVVAKANLGSHPDDPGNDEDSSEKSSAP